MPSANAPARSPRACAATGVGTSPSAVSSKKPYETMTRPAGSSWLSGTSTPRDRTDAIALSTHTESVSSPTRAMSCGAFSMGPRSVIGRNSSNGHRPSPSGAAHVLDRVRAGSWSVPPCRNQARASGRLGRRGARHHCSRRRPAITASVVRSCPRPRTRGSGTLPRMPTSTSPFIVDADSHWSEPPDLFTKMAPAEFKDRVPHVEVVDGERTWVFDGHPMGRFSAGGVIDREGVKEEANIALFEWEHEMIHVGAWDPDVRLKVMDECGIDAQVIFPSTIGLGGQDLGMVDDDALRHLAVELYNDRMAEVQEGSGNRLLPMPIMPAWSVESCVREARRVAAMGARGVNMTSD